MNNRYSTKPGIIPILSHKQNGKRPFNRSSTTWRNSKYRGRHLDVWKISGYSKLSMGILVGTWLYSGSMSRLLQKLFHSSKQHHILHLTPNDHPLWLLSGNSWFWYCHPGWGSWRRNGMSPKYVKHKQRWLHNFKQVHLWPCSNSMVVL